MVSIIKLTNGTEVIGSVLEENKQMLVIDNPLQINYITRSPADPPIISLHRYIPFSNKTIISFKQEHVLGKVEPLHNMVSYYNTSLKNIQLHIDPAIDNELASASDVKELSDESLARLAVVEKHVTKATLN
jgi:hypothetical protein